MIRIETPNVQALLLRLDEKSRAIKQGASRGIEKSVAELADDVAAHTMARSGHARGSVYGRMPSQLRGEVGYAGEVAWYMHIVELSGARPHTIIPRGRKERNRRAALSRSSMQKRILYGALKAGGVDAGRLAALTGKGGGLRFLKLALSIAGEPKAAVRNPGFRPHLVLRSRLAANQQHIAENVEISIAERLAQ